MTSKVKVNKDKKCVEVWFYRLNENTNKYLWSRVGFFDYALGFGRDDSVFRGNSYKRFGSWQNMMEKRTDQKIIWDDYTEINWQHVEEIREVYNKML